MKQAFTRIFLVAMVTFATFTLFAQRAALSGDWKLDEKKSDLGEFARAATSIKNDQKENAITITRITPGFNGGDPMTSTITLPFDGKVVESEGFRGSKRKSTAKWSDDGKTLVVSNTMSFERDGQTSEFKSTESWSLTKDGQLSVVTHSNSPRGESTVKAIYSK